METRHGVSTKTTKIFVVSVSFVAFVLEPSAVAAP